MRKLKNNEKEIGYFLFTLLFNFLFVWGIISFINTQVDYETTKLYFYMEKYEVIAQIDGENGRKNSYLKDNKSNILRLENDKTRTKGEQINLLVQLDSTAKDMIDDDIVRLVKLDYDEEDFSLVNEINEKYRQME